MSDDIINSATDVAKNGDLIKQSGADAGGANESPITNPVQSDNNNFSNVDKINHELKQRRLESKELKERLEAMNAQMAETQKALKSITSSSERVNEMHDALVSAEMRALAAEYGAVDSEVVSKMVDMSKVKFTRDGVNGLKEQFDDLRAKKTFLFAPKKSSGAVDFSSSPDGQKIDATKMSKAEYEQGLREIDRMR
jgi:Cu/Ag efflux protein CusF